MEAVHSAAVVFSLPSSGVQWSCSRVGSISFMKPLGYSRTYPTNCRDCGAEILFHTKGHGDVVLFDDLGPPWPIHRGYIAWTARGVLTNRPAYKAYMLNLYGKPFNPKVRPGGAHRLAVARQRPKKQPSSAMQYRERPVDIDRCDPQNFVGRQIEVTGFVHDFHPGWSIRRLAKEGSIGYSIYEKVLKSEEYSQLTIVDSDLMSYTVMVPVPKLNLRTGEIVGARIEAVETLGEAIFVCRSLGSIDFRAK